MPDTTPAGEQPDPPLADHVAPGDSSMDMLSVRADGDGVLFVSGDIDLAGGPVLERHIEASAQGADGRSVTVDLRGVSFIDSSGLRSLLAASRAAAERNARLTLRHPSPGVCRLLDITGTGDQFDIASDR